MGRPRRSHSAFTEGDTVRGVQSWRWAMSCHGTSLGHVVDHSILCCANCTYLAARNMMPGRMISQPVSLNGFQMPQRPTFFSLP